MARIFKENRSRSHKPKYHGRPPKQEHKDLVDPVLYVGDLDGEKYPFLPPSKKEEHEEDVENPLNRR